MYKKRSTFTKSYQEKKILDSILWLIENYLPQKKKRTSHSEFHLSKFESFTINKIKELTSARSKSMKGDFSNRKVTFVVGKWALPYLNLLKSIKIIK